jgi:hypothetical protein
VTSAGSQSRPPPLADQIRNTPAGLNTLNASAATVCRKLSSPAGNRLPFTASATAPRTGNAMASARMNRPEWMNNSGSTVGLIRLLMSTA